VVHGLLLLLSIEFAISSWLRRRLEARRAAEEVEMEEGVGLGVGAGLGVGGGGGKRLEDVAEG